MWSWGHGWWMSLWWILIAAGVLWLVWITSRAPRRGHEGPSAEELLRRRYAEGEITEEEYRQRLSPLRGGHC